MTAFAKTGLVAVIDEVTGYQADRDRDELQKVLEKYISAELLPWAKRFPDEFYPAYYDSFSKRIKDALDQYKEKVISEAEYLAKMRTIMEDYHAGKSSVTYPESIKNNVHAQAFYGVLSAVFDEAKEAEVSPDFVAEIAEEITKIVADHSQVDWTNNKTIHDRISQDIDDLFYDYEKERGLKLSFDTIDKIIENVKTVALRRF